VFTWSVYPNALSIDGIVSEEVGEEIKHYGWQRILTRDRVDRVSAYYLVQLNDRGWRHHEGSPNFAVGTGKIAGQETFSMEASKGELVSQIFITRGLYVGGEYLTSVQVNLGRCVDGSERTPQCSRRPTDER